MNNINCSLIQLLESLPVAGGVPDIKVTALSVDSRDITSGCLFIALKGEKVDAREFIDTAFKQGAAAVLVDADEQPSLDAQISRNEHVISVLNLSAHLSLIAGRFYQHPSKELKVIGITGTNGKTTIAYYLAQMLETLGLRSALMGTLGSGQVGALNSTGMTTLDAVTVQKQLALFVTQEFDVVCMEVSSHGLALGRVSEIKFEHVVFSNLSQDHLDFHHNMHTYAQTKRSLFTDYDVSCAIINQDDELGKSLLKTTKNHISFGINEGVLRADEISLSTLGLKFVVDFDTQNAKAQSDLIGEFNVSNLLAVMGVGLALGFTLEQMVKTLSKCQAAPGRMQRIKAGLNQANVVVDYAHTPDALQNALSACQAHCDGDLSVVFGCGGDRDNAKRAQMGKIAEQYADTVFITDDNPRTESAAKIVADIVSGMQQPCWVIHDRAQAITTAVNRSGADDWVLIAGKGHENKQIFADYTIEMDDRVLAEKALARLAA